MVYIKQTGKLSEDQLSQIYKLEASCRSYDNTNSSISLAQELNFHKDMDCFFLAYEGEKLAGLVSIFAPVKGEAEISALVEPDKRQQGLFKSLLKKAADELSRFNVETVYLVHDAASVSGGKLLERWGAAVDHSEYLLVYDKAFSGAESDTEVSIKQTYIEDLEETVRLALGIFGGNADSWTALCKKSYESPNILSFTAYSGSEPVGICSVNQTEQGLFIFGFGILAAYRRKGLGRGFLAAVIRKLMKDFDDSILLEVDSENFGAYKLYTSNGFKEKVRFDYHNMNLSDIKMRLEC